MKKQIILATLFVALVFLSCVRDPSKERDKYRGKWITSEVDGVKINPDKKLVYKLGIYPDLTIDSSVNSTKSTYTLAENKLILNQKIYDIVSVDDASLNLKSQLGKTIKLDKIDLAEKLFSVKDSLANTWQCQSKNGELFDTFRIKFNTKGEYSIYENTQSGWVIVEAQAGTFKTHFKYIVLAYNSTNYFSTVAGSKNSCFDIISLSPSKQELTIKNQDYTYVFSLVVNQ